MGKIIKAGVEHYFSGGIGSGSDIVILTQEEYDELVTNNTVESGVYYFIEDVNIEGGNNVVNDASDIIYDNSTSGLEADNVQDAIDEVSGDVSELNQNLKFPDGVGFYPDTKDGKRGYNTDPARGADTFFPFKGDYNIEIVNGNSPAGTAQNITIPPCEFFVVVAIDVQDLSSSITYSISGATVLNEKISNSLTYSTKALYTRVYTAVCEGVDETTIVTITTSQFVQVGSKQIFAYCFVN